MPTPDGGQVSLYSVKGKLKLGKGIRNPYAQRTVGGADRLPTDDGGHLIGRQFKGSGQIDNLVPQSREHNRAGGVWYQMEQMWADTLKKGGTVEVDIQIIYPENSGRPEGFQVHYYLNDEAFSKTVFNT